MIRRPLRPLARILRARAEGGNPDAIEAENKRLRHEEMRDRDRARAEGRLVVLGAMFFLAFASIGGRMGVLAASEAAEPTASAGGNPVIATRADIVDRNGRILATNLDTHSLYVHPREVVDAAAAKAGLAEIFPEMTPEQLDGLFDTDRAFRWVRSEISPEQMQAVFEIGEPGLLFGPREMRLYPNGPVAAHILGGTQYGEQWVDMAEIEGTAGVEKYFDAYLRDPANEGAPLMLSIDLTVQAAVEEVLAGGMMLMNAKGASAVLMDARSGEIVSMVSLPDFDPNDRPVATMGDRADSPIFNRALQGLYELGSVFKIFPVAQALELGLVGPETMVDTQGPMRIGGFPIRDFRDYGPQLSTTDVIVKSSNIGTARLAIQIGAERQRDFLRDLGLLEPTPVEMVEAATARPQFPADRNWGEASIGTISYGHGISSSPVHLAQAYATIVNGGTRVEATLLRRTGPVPGERVISERVSAISRQMLRLVVSADHGTASFAEVPGYRVGGKTGTADKPDARGRYYDDKVIATFASVFPADDPQYVLVVSLDEPVETSGDVPRRTAGWTAVPVAAEIIRRAAPLMGLRPDMDSLRPTGVTLTSD